MSVRTARRPANAALMSALENRRLFATVPVGFIDAAFGTQINDGTAMEFAPDGRLFVLTQGGSVRVVQRNGSLNSTPALQLHVDDVDSVGERGLLGIAFDPTFNAGATGADYVYLYYTVPNGADGSAGAFNRIARFTVNGDTIDPLSRSIVMNLDPLTDATNHNGGAIHFGTDGKLYAAVGDNAARDNAQSVNNRHGKMLRINKEGTIPTDNPTSFQLANGSGTGYTTGTPTGNNRAIWAVGLRNPFTFAIQPGTGRMHINDVGETSFEEVNVGGSGRNYGWPRTEGNFSTATAGNEKLTPPIHAYGRGNAYPLGRVVTGGTFYDGGTAALQFPQAYQNDYFFGEFAGAWLATLDLPPASPTVTQFASSISGVVDLKSGPDGALYTLQRASGAAGVVPGVHRISVNPTAAPSITTQPTSRTVDQGRSTTFSVTATGPGTLTYQWTRNGVDIANATSSTYTLASAQLSDDNAVYRVRVSNSGGIQLSNGATLDVLADQIFPQIVSQNFNRNDAQHRITTNLSEAINPTTTAGAVTLINVATGAAVPLASVVFNAAQATIVVTPASRLGDGRYRLALNGLTDLAGNPLLASPFNFGFLRGDADADGSVGFNDLVSLAQNYNKASNFTGGDFDYSGIVDFQDLVILAQRYNQSLPAITSMPAASSTTSVGTKAKKRAV